MIRTSTLVLTSILSCVFAQHYGQDESELYFAPRENYPGYPYPYQASPYEASPYEASPYEASPYQASPYQASPYEASPYQASPYQASPYEASPYQASPYEASPYEASPYEASPYEASPYEQPVETYDGYEESPYQPRMFRSMGPPFRLWRKPVVKYPETLPVQPITVYEPIRLVSVCTNCSNPDHKKGECDQPEFIVLLKEKFKKKRKEKKRRHNPKLKSTNTTKQKTIVQ